MILHTVPRAALPLLLLSSVQGQTDVAQCGVCASNYTFMIILTLLELTCIADVSNSGGNCVQSQWSCLCLSQAYLRSVSDCAQRACSESEYDTTISTLADLCSVIDEPVSIQPYATASTGSINPSVTAFTASSAASIAGSSSLTASTTVLSGTRTGGPAVSSTAQATASASTSSSPTMTSAAYTNERWKLSALVEYMLACGFLALAMYL